MNLQRSRYLAVLPQSDLSIFPPKGGKKRRLSGFLRLAAMMAALGLGSTGAWAAVCTVSSTADTNTSGTLRYCLNNYSAGDTINLTATGTITLASALAPMVNNVTITGPGPNQLTINGANAPAGTSIFSIGSTVSSPTVTISGLTFTGGNGTQGGAIAGFSNLTVTNCAFSGNTAVTGGAISDSGPVTVTGSTFSGNSSTNGGGAIAAGTGTLTVINSTFSGNSSSYGGAIYSISGLAVTNSTFSGNSGTGAGAIYTTGGTGTVANSIFTGNSATAAGQGAALLSVPAVPLNASYNLYYKNLDAGTTEDDCVGCTTNTNAVTGSNPNLMPLGYYGGTTQTFLSQPGSPAICNGLASAASSAGLTIDQRGFAMNPSYTPCPAGSVDIGAVQANYLQVTSAADSGVGSLRAAVTAANTSGYGDIDFAAAVSTINLSSSVALEGTGGINIIGSPGNAVTLNGGGSGSNFGVLGVDVGVPAFLDWLTISKGNTNFGGGIFNGGTLTIANSTISGNSAASDGGGIANGGTLQIANSTVSGNSSASYGGGIENGGTLQIAESTISGNSATSATAATYGGGIYNAGALITAVNTTIANNSVSGTTDNGGGIYLNTGTVNLSNSIVSGNTTVHGANANIAVNGTLNAISGNVIGGNTNATSNLVNGTGAAITLSPLQINGSAGTTLQTMLPLPGSAAICAGLSSNIASGATTDERGFPLQPAGGACSSTNVDAGAVQTNYTGVSFQQQPTTAFIGTPIIPPPTVQVLETNALTNATDAPNGIPITLTYTGPGTLSGNTATTSGGVATFSGLSINQAGMNQQLQASITAGNLTLQAQSNDFNVIGPAVSLQVTAPATTTSGVPFNVAVTAYDVAGNVATGYTGAVAFSSSDTSTYKTLPGNYTFNSADAGVHVFNNLALVTAAASQTVQVNDNNPINPIQGTATLSVTKANPTVLLAPAGAAINVDGSVTFTAAVSAPANATEAGPFLGTMSFSSNGIPIANCTAIPANNTALCTTSALLAGSDSITAIYSGDASYNQSPTSASITQTVNKAATLVTMTAAGAAINVDGSVTFTATVKPSVGLVSVPFAGTMSFASNGTAIAACTTQSVNATTGVATCTTTALLAGSDAITATYSGDSNYITSPVSASTSQTVIKAATTVIMTAAGPAINVDGSVTFTATVAPSAGTVSVPFAGTMSFASNGTAIAACTTQSVNAATGVATCTTTALLAGSDAITATYSGDSNYLTSPASASTSQTVIKASTTVTMTPAGAAINVDGSVTFIATVAPNAGSVSVPFAGTMSFASNGTALAGCTVQTVTATTGVATCTTTALLAGSDAITATYSGDSNYNTSLPSTSTTQTVNKEATTVTMTAAGAAINLDASVTFTATVSPNAGSISVPFAGSVSFASNGKSIACTSSAFNPATGVATCTTAALPAGGDVITATFAGDSNYNLSPTSAPTTQAVNALAATLPITASPAGAVAAGTTVTFTAMLAASALSPVNPSGKVAWTLNNSSTADCPVSTIALVSGNWVATCTTGALTAPSASITATYSSDSNYTTAAPGQLAETVTQAQASASLALTSPASPAVNQAITLTATVKPPTGASTEVLPGGYVTFKDTTTGITLCSTVPVTQGTSASSAACTPTGVAATDLTAGASHTITANYTGDTNFLAATSPGLSQSISQTATNVAVTSSSAISVATQAVTFTATVTPTMLGAIAPASSSTVKFTSSDGTVNCAAAAVTPQANGTGIATCTATFPSSEPVATPGVTLTAVFSGDTNFITNTGNGSQTVQNFGVAFTSPATPATTAIAVTQGYSNTSDPFNAAAIAMTVTSSGGYGDTLLVTCTVTSLSTQKAVTDPSCSPASTSAPGTTGAKVAYTISASSSASVGAYTVSLSATDSTVPALKQTTITQLTVFVVGNATQLTQISGVTGTDNVVFDTATPLSGKAPTSLGTFSCPFIWNLATPGTAPFANNGYVTCTGSTTPVTGSQTQVSISITALTTTAQLQVKSTMTLAALWGLPLLVIMGWFGSRKSPRRNFLRFIGAILLIVAASFTVTGCGGSFTSTGAITAANGKLAVGNYLIQVVGLDQNGVSYSAVVPLEVTAP